MPMESIPGELWTALGVSAAALIAFFGTKLTASAQKAAAEKPDWQGFSDSIKTWTQERLAERDAKITQLEADVGHLRNEVSTLRRKYNAALDLVRRWTRRHPDTKIPVPEEIADDL